MFIKVFKSKLSNLSTVFIMNSIIMNHDNPTIMVNTKIIKERMKKEGLNDNNL